MTDEKIIELFFRRDEQAIRESVIAYGAYCRSIASGILSDPSDAEEAVADTWLAAWNSIPPNRPKYLRLFLGSITRNRALTQWRRNHAESRGGGETAIALEELGECVGAVGSPEDAVNTKQLGQTITEFLRREPAMRRNVFLRRYYYMESIADIASRYGLKEANVRMMLSRTRQKLRNYLKQEGYTV